MLVSWRVCFFVDGFWTFGPSKSPCFFVFSCFFFARFGRLLGPWVFMRVAATVLFSYCCVLSISQCCEIGFLRILY